jgi:NADH:ubiquinone oxidoreductase subunit H
MTATTALLLSFVWLAVLGISIGAVACFERRARLLPVAARATASLRRREWGGELDRPPADHAIVRALAFFARWVGRRARVEGESQGLLRASRMLSLSALLSGLALLPLASGGQRGDAAFPTSPGSAAPRVLFDSEQGLALVVFLVLVSGLAHTATGLAERNDWARLAAVRVAGCALAGVALLLLVLAPIALGTGSLRFSEIAIAQAGSFAPFDLFGLFGGLRLPNWFLFRQPLTAMLAVPTFALLLSRSLLLDGRGQSSGPTGYGLDADPSFAYGARLEARVAEILAAALFVTLFLGGSGLPFLDARPILGPAQALLGSGLPALLFFFFEVSVFVGKLVFVLFAIQVFRRTTGSLRIDQSLEIVTRRLLPLAWANLLLLAALSLMRSGIGNPA